MKNQWKKPSLDLNNIRNLNSSRSESGFNTVPTSFTEITNLLNSSINLDNGFIDNKSSLDMFIALQMQYFATYISSHWEYSDSFYEDLGLDKYQFDQMLIDNSSVAIINDDSYGLLVFPYNVLDFNIYNQPLTITLNCPTSNVWNLKEYTSDQFVIIENDNSKLNTMTQVLSWLEEAYNILIAFHDNVNEGQTHFLKLNIPNIDIDGSTNAIILGDMMKKREKIISYTPTFLFQPITKEDELNSGDLMEQWNSQLQSLDFKDRLDLLWDSYMNVMQEVYKIFGIQINLNVSKNQTQISTEITSVQDQPIAKREVMFLKRVYGLNKVNKKWGTDWAIERVKQNLNEYKYSEQTKGVDEND